MAEVEYLRPATAVRWSQIHFPMLQKLMPKADTLPYLRYAIALIFLTHGITRIRIDGVEGFGEFLSSSGFPAGVVIAWVITVFELAGACLLALDIGARVVAVLFTLELLCGIALVHFSEGWFVVGAGRNGFEYSFLLIVSLLTIILSDPKPATQA